VPLKCNTGKPNARTFFDYSHWIGTGVDLFLLTSCRKAPMDAWKKQFTRRLPKDVSSIPALS
jgi:hypothetical protein